MLGLSTSMASRRFSDDNEYHVIFLIICLTGSYQETICWRYWTYIFHHIIHIRTICQMEVRVNKQSYNSIKLNIISKRIIDKIWCDRGCSITLPLPFFSFLFFLFLFYLLSDMASAKWKENWRLIVRRRCLGHVRP